MGWPEQVFKWLGYGKYSASPTAVADGATSPLLIDPYGKLRVIAEINGSATYTPLYATSGSAKRGVIKSSAGSLRYVQVSSKDASGCWLLLMNKASLPINTDTAVIFPLWVPAGETRAVNLPADLPFPTGIAWAASSTPGDVTLMAGDNLWVTGFYL
jgi:hypothetical protein